MATTPRVTIMDVALKAGVSRQTVSRAMNDMAEISVATREKVLAASDELGYRPSRFASNMPRQKTHAIGLAITSLRNPYYTDLAAEFLDEFAARGWQVVLSAGPAASGRHVAASLSSQVDAMIGYFDTDPDLELKRAARGVPLVRLESISSRHGIHGIGIDFENGVRDFLTGLRARGARRIGMIEHGPSGSDAYQPSTRRVWFEKFAEARDRRAIARGDDTIAGGAAAFDQLRAEHPEIDTVLAFNDMMALGAIQRAHQLGLRVPEDIRVAGIDGLTLGAATFPLLTSLSIDGPLIAKTSADLLTELLSSDAAHSRSRRLRITPQPVWRESA